MKYLLFTLILFGFAACNFTGFKTQKPKKYAGTGPKFEITKNLNGKMLSEGVLFGPNGSVVERFVAENGVMINKSEMRKFGIKVAELVGNIRPAK